jgi:uncharacterized protein (TIGR03435 family)
MTSIRALVIVACAALLLQSTRAQRLEFEVASVKLGDPGAQRTSLNFRGEELRVGNLPLRGIAEWAYDIRPLFHRGLLEGGPSWIDNETFAIVAKASSPLSADVGRAMLRTLLADRFKLRVHTVSREMPVFALVLARKDGALGPGLRRSDKDCAAFSTAVMKAEQSGVGRLRVNGCDYRAGGGPGGITIHATIMLDAAALLMSRSRDIDRPIVNRTGLDGTYDLDLHFTERQTVTSGVVPADGASIFTAVQEQLGLKLDSQRMPMDVVVIDSVERPMPD